MSRGILTIIEALPSIESPVALVLRSEDQLLGANETVSLNETEFLALSRRSDWAITHIGMDLWHLL